MQNGHEGRERGRIAAAVVIVMPLLRILSRAQCGKRRREIGNEGGQREAGSGDEVSLEGMTRDFSLRCSRE